MVLPVGDEDRTGRARVRDAALAEFAERGLAGASVRSVAARAGVSPGLVQHHFAIDPENDHRLPRHMVFVPSRPNDPDHSLLSQNLGESFYTK